MTRAAFIDVGCQPTIVEFDGIGGLQELCGGYIDSAPFVFGDAPAVYVNDMGKLNGMEPNRAVASQDGEIADVLYGPIVCAGVDWETGEDRDLSDAEFERVVGMFGGAFPESICGAGSGHGVIALRRMYGVR